MFSPKIEPEVVFKLAKTPASSDPVAVLEATEWYALGFEIIDCVFPDWKFQPADFVAARGLHAALVVGEPVYVEPEDIAKLVTDMAEFTVRLLRNNELVEEGAAKNALKSPVLCVGELAEALEAPRRRNAAGRRSDQHRHADHVAADDRRRHLDRVAVGHPAVVADAARRASYRNA